MLAELNGRKVKDTPASHDMRAAKVTRCKVPSWWKQTCPHRFSGQYTVAVMSKTAGHTVRKQAIPVQQGEAQNLCVQHAQVRRVIVMTDVQCN